MNNIFNLTSDKNGTLPHIVFNIADKKYGINIKYVTEIINMPALEMPISPPEGIIGIFNYNGIMIKAVDLRPFLGFESEKFSLNNRFIIIMSEGNFFAIHTDYIDNIILPEKDNIQPLPFEAKDPLVNKIYKGSDDTVNIIDVEMLNYLINKNSDKKSETDYKNLIPSDEKSQMILNLRAGQIKKSEDVFSFSFNLNTLDQYILFVIAGQNYYIDLKYVKEFVSAKRLSVTKLPYTKEYIAGMVNLGGEFLVLVDLNCFLNNDISPVTDSSKIIVTEGEDFNIALLVDEVKYIKNLTSSQVTPQDSGFSKYVQSEFKENDVLYTILNFEKIITDEKLYVNIQ